MAMIKTKKTLKKRAINWKLFLIPALCLVGLFLFYYIVPTASGTYTITVLNGALIFYVANIGCALMLGQCGLVSFASVAFMGIGGYASALLAARLGMNPFLAMLLAAVLAMLIAWLLGLVLMRLNGTFFTFSTIALVQICYTIFNGWKKVTGGPNGISQIPKPTFFGLEFSRSAREGGWDTFSNFFGVKYDPSDRVIFLYLVALLLVVLSLFVINRLLRMPLGRAWEALREDEIACRSLGLSPTRIKLTAFTISAAFAGFAGTLFAARQGFVSPESFTFAESAFVLAIVVLGGMGSQFAVILAAILLVVSRELMRDFNEYSMLMLGGLMVLMMIWRPQGLLPMTRVQLKLKNGQAKGEQA